MKLAFSQAKRNEFIDATVSGQLLDEIVEWIGDNLCPDDVFSEELLDQWAEDNDYERKDS